VRSQGLKDDHLVKVTSEPGVTDNRSPLSVP
jgi:hypothetical protein